MAEKKNILTYEGLKKLEDELQDLKVVQRREIAQKIKEAREQGDLSENAEYDAAKDEQRDIEARIEQIEKILKNPRQHPQKKRKKSLRQPTSHSPHANSHTPSSANVKKLSNVPLKRLRKPRRQSNNAKPTSRPSKPR